MSMHHIQSSRVWRRAFWLVLAGILAGNATTFSGRPVGVSLAPNLLANPSFERSLAGWGSFRGTATRVADASAPDGRAVALVAGASGTDYTFDSWFSRVPVTASGQPFRASAFIAAGSPSSVGKPLRLVLRETQTDGEFVRSFSTPIVPVSRGYRELQVAGVATRGGDLMEIYAVQGNAVPGNSFKFDNARLVTATGTIPVPTATPMLTPTAVPTASPTPAPTAVPTATPMPTPTMVPAATPLPAPRASVLVTFSSGVAGKCLDDLKDSVADRNPVAIFTCDGSAAQHWTVRVDSTITINGRCLGVLPGGTGNGTTVEVLTCNGNASQRWRAGARGELVNLESGKCLDDPRSSTIDRTPLDIWTCVQSPSERWLPISVSG